MSSAAKYSKATDDARAYANEHDLERTITQMINMVVTYKPQDPKGLMIRWLLERCTPEQQEIVDLEITRELPKKPPLDERSREAYERYMRSINPQEEEQRTEDGDAAFSIYSGHDSATGAPVVPHNAALSELGQSVSRAGTPPQGSPEASNKGSKHSSRSGSKSSKTRPPQPASRPGSKMSTGTASG